MTRHHNQEVESVAFSPRKRAARKHQKNKVLARTEETCLLGFPGYKVGMNHLKMLDNVKTHNKWNDNFSSKNN